MQEAVHTRFAVDGETAPSVEMDEMGDVEELVRVEADRNVPSAAHKVPAEDEHEVVQVAHEHEYCRMTNDDWHLTVEVRLAGKTQYDFGWEFRRIHYRTLVVVGPAQRQQKQSKHSSRSFLSQ